jgi:hypothetical protein
LFRKQQQQNKQTTTPKKTSWILYSRSMNNKIKHSLGQINATNTFDLMPIFSFVLVSYVAYVRISNFMFVGEFSCQRLLVYTIRSLCSISRKIRIFIWIKRRMMRLV